MVTIGIDNGVSGGIGIISPDSYNLFHVPTFRDLNYQKSEETYITRIDVYELIQKLNAAIEKYPNDDFKIMIERPMINPHMFTSSITSARALEAVLIALSLVRNEKFPNGLPKHYLDSKSWQSVLLPHMVKPKTTKDMDSKEKQKLNREYSKKLKEAAYHKAIQMFPNIKDKIKVNADADSMLIAEYCRIYYTNQTN